MPFFSGSVKIARHNREITDVSVAKKNIAF
jgi:hypothetical protein